jgi:DNA methylase
MTNATLGSEAHLTFKGNLQQSRYGWLRLTSAYSVHLVADLLDRWARPDTVVLDPYCGTGTTALVCAEKGLASYTTDINPFLVWLAGAKTARYTPEDIADFTDTAAGVVAAISSKLGYPEWVPALHQIEKWWDEATLHALGRVMATIRERDGQVSSAASDLLRVAFCRTLIARANVSFGHQSMSFRKRKDQELLLGAEHQEDLVRETWASAVDALAESATSQIEELPEVLLCDARELTDIGRAIDCVITSPPYPNRMSYIRELRPYMYWLGYLSDGRAAGELDWQAIGGTWGCATSNVGKWTPAEVRVIPHDNFATILSQIAVRSDLLSRYVHKYFYDMTDHIGALASTLAPDATIHYIVGNSKFYDVMLPVQEIYAGMFSEAGLVDVEIKKIRKRSSKRELFEFVVSARRAA